MFVFLSSFTVHSIGSIICTNPPQKVIVIYAKHLSPFPRQAHNRSLPWMDSQFPRNQGGKTQGSLERSIRCFFLFFFFLKCTLVNGLYWIELKMLSVEACTRKFFISRALFTSMLLAAEACSLNNNHSGRVNSFEMHFVQSGLHHGLSCTTALVSEENCIVGLTKDRVH